LAIRKHPAVVLRTYGYARLKDLMVATGLFELQRSGPGKSGAVQVRVEEVLKHHGDGEPRS
jgi:hypothetical protein